MISRNWDKTKVNIFEINMFSILEVTLKLKKASLALNMFIAPLALFKIYKLIYTEKYFIDQNLIYDIFMKYKNINL